MSHSEVFVIGAGPAGLTAAYLLTKQSVPTTVIERDPTYVVSYLQAQAFPHEKPTSFHDWVANQFGERLFSIFFKTYTEKVWSMSCDEISVDWAAQRIEGLDHGAPWPMPFADRSRRSSLPAGRTRRSSP
jgi:protoporphyrinogen oxidase